jgi:hypothetical protein
VSTARSDLNHDGRINIGDVSAASSNNGHRAP